jgi:hypothetical protein
MRSDTAIGALRDIDLALSFTAGSITKRSRPTRTQSIP